MSDQQTIVDSSVVSIHYSLKLDDGQDIDSSAGGDPLAYLHGSQNIVPGLESQLTGKSVGDKVDVVVPAEEGYGQRMDGAEQVVSRDELPPDLEVVPGMPIGAEAADGSTVTLYVSEVNEETITVDMNHPLAGQNLHFSVEIMEIRDASEEEKAHGHPHGPGGHHH